MPHPTPLRALCRALAAFAALACLAPCPAARAETVLLEPFFIDEDRPMPCDAQEILSIELQSRGCMVWEAGMGTPPDLAITGDYEDVGGVGWLTLRVFDTVVGRVALGERLYIPKDAWMCQNVVRNLTEKILSPPYFERQKHNYLDGVSGIEFVLVPGGTFRPQVGRGKLMSVPSFFISRFEVTQAQWERIMGSNPATFTGNPDRPVESVSWYDVKEYIEKLQEITRQPYRLPSELEWEYASQTRGRGTRWSGSNSPAEVDTFAWTATNSNAQTHPVGQKKANGLGLYDMSGNVWEWCEDWYDGNLGNEEPKNAKNELRGKVIRGGSWLVDDTYATTASREKAAPESRSSDNGFRLVLPVINK